MIIREGEREKKSGRECVIIEQENAAVLEWHAGPRSHQKCNDSKRQNMIFNRH